MLWSDMDGAERSRVFFAAAMTHLTHGEAWPEEEASSAIKEYISEAEHQDGEEFWENFPSIGEALDDLDLYLEHAS